MLAAARVGGGTAWASRGRRFAANLRALRERHPAAAGLVEAAAGELEGYALHLPGDGNYQISRDGAWLGGLRDHKAATAMWSFDKAQTPVPSPVLFDGIGFGWLFLEIFRTTTNTYNGYSPALYVLEPDPLALTMVLHLHDLQEALRHPRTRMFVGGDPLEAFKQAVRKTPGWSVPEQFVRCQLRERALLPLEETINELRAERAKRRNAVLAEAEGHYRDKTSDFWSKRLVEAAPLKILAITSRYTTVLQYAVEELRQAARELGHEMRVAIEPDDESLENPFPDQLAAFRPDLIVQISRLRYENPSLPRNVPFLCWDQDNLPCMRTDAATASLDALTFVAGHGALHGWSFHGWPRRNVIFCHPAASAFRYPATPAAPELLEKHACDVSFISNAAVTPEEIAGQQAARWQGSPELSAVFAACAGEVLAGGQSGRAWEFADLQRMIGGKAALPEQATNELALSLSLVADRAFRHAALHWAANFCEAHRKTLRLYGNGWETHPRFARYAAGPARQGAEVHAIYQASRINLQLIEGGFLHSRSLDGLASGAFFLTRSSPNDSRGDALSQALFTLGTRAVALGLRTLRDLRASGDGAVLAAMGTLGSHLDGYAADEPLPALENWAALPQAPVLFPQLAQIRFGSEAEFAALAERYLGDAAARREIAAGMQGVVQAQFTHTQRLRTFVAEVRAALRGA
jgi:hypothetical protein